MFAHCLPLIIRERSVLMENPIWHTHFANIMQERPTPNIEKCISCDSHAFRDLFSKHCHTLGMALCFPIAEIKCRGPAFQCGFIGKAEICIGTLEIVEK